MRNPFEKERKADIGLDMKPFHLMIKGNSGKLPIPKSSKNQRSFGIKTNKQSPEREQKETVLLSNRKGPSEKSVTNNTNSPRKLGSGRRCIVKVDPRNYYNPNLKGAILGNKRLIQSRLAPFIKPDNGHTGSKVAYIGRNEALEGSLFSYENGTIVGWEGQEATKAFKEDPTMTVILSPEDSGADLLELTRRFMEEVYRSNCPERPRLWVAGIHGNTRHKHVHILVSCIGENGGDARVREKTLYNGRLKNDTERILTQIQGERGWSEIAEAQRRRANRARLTPEDTLMFTAIRKRKREAIKNDEIVQEGLFVLKDIEEKKKRACSRRLQELKKMGLVTKEDDSKKGEWIFASGAEDKLRISEFEEEFGLTKEDIKGMYLDHPFDNEYSGEILEMSEIRNGNYMLFLIKDLKTGIIHLHREKIDERKETKLRQEVMVDLKKIKGMLQITKNREQK